MDRAWEGPTLTPGTTVTVNQLDGGEDPTYVSALSYAGVLTEAYPGYRPSA